MGVFGGGKREILEINKQIISRLTLTQFDVCLLIILSIKANFLIAIIHTVILLLYSVSCYFALQLIHIRYAVIVIFTSKFKQIHSTDIPGKIPKLIYFPPHKVSFSQ